MFDENTINYYYIFRTLNSLFIDLKRKEKNINNVDIESINLEGVSIEPDFTGAYDVIKKAEDYITESGAEGLTARPIELPSGFKTVDAYAIKLSPEMVMPSKTHMASGGYVRSSPLVTMNEMIGAA